MMREKGLQLEADGVRIGQKFEPGKRVTSQSPIFISDA
jgi:hypothetical protein